MKAVKTILKRQILKFLGSNGQILNLVVSPILMVVLFSYIYANEAESLLTDVSSFQVIIAGMIAVTTFNEGLQAGSSFADDKEKGYMREFLIAPIRRSQLLCGLMIANIITSLVTPTILVIFSIFVGCRYTFIGLLMMLIGLVVSATIGNSLGIFIACRTKKEGLERTFLFISLPFIALSGAYVPLTLFPDWLVYVSYFNPLTYLVSFFKYISLGSIGVPLEEMYASKSVISFLHPYACFAIFVVMAVGMFSWTAATFDKKLMK